jgi:hypothetical protein
MHNFLKNGYCKIEKFIEPEVLAPIKKFLDECISLNQGLKKHSEHFAMVDQPFLNAPGVLELALDEDILTLMTMYLGPGAALGTCNLRSSFVTETKERTTTMFHRDNNSKNFLKVFFYLNDVRTPEEGTFTYMEGSHIFRKEKEYVHGSRWTDKQVTDLYGEDKLVCLTANVGDLLLANTTGFHKGTQCKTQGRAMLTLNYTTEEEKFGRFKISQVQYDQLTIDQKHRCRYLDVV